MSAVAAVVAGSACVWGCKALVTAVVRSQCVHAVVSSTLATLQRALNTDRQLYSMCVRRSRQLDKMCLYGCALLLD
jgi:hypothetical protein